MPEILKHQNGETNWVAIFSGVAASIVLILQQWQTYKIAELRTEAEVNKINFLAKDEVYKIANDLEDRIERLEIKIIELERHNDGK